MRVTKSFMWGMAAVCAAAPTFAVSHDASRVKLSHGQGGTMPITSGPPIVGTGGPDVPTSGFVSVQYYIDNIAMHNGAKLTLQAVRDPADKDAAKFPVEITPSRVDKFQFYEGTTTTQCSQTFMVRALPARATGISQINIIITAVLHLNPDEDTKGVYQRRIFRITLNRDTQLAFTKRKWFFVPELDDFDWSKED